MSTHNQNVNLDIGGLLSRALDVVKQDFVNWAIIGLVGQLAFGVGVWGGYHYCAQKQLAGQKPEVADVLRPFSNIQMIIPGILIGIAACFLVIPGVILGVLWAFVIPLMVQRNLGWQDAARISKAAVMDNLGQTILLLLLVGFVGGIGSGACGLGLLITVPMAQVILYLGMMEFFGGTPTPQQLDYAPGAPAPMAAPPTAAPHAVPVGPPPAAAPPAAAPPAAAPPAAAPPAAAPPAAAPPAAAPPAAAPSAAAPQAVDPPPAAPAAEEPPTAAPAPGVLAPDAGDAEDDDVVETAQQATAGEAVQGKTMAMSSVDFEAMLKNRNKPSDE